MRALVFLAFSALACASPAAAQSAQHGEHGSHHQPQQQADTPAADPHAGHAMPQADPHAGHRMSTAPTLAPDAAGRGPARAADAIWGADAMRASRAALVAEHGATRYGSVRVDRLEHRARRGADGYLWDADAWYGGDLDKLWLKTEGEGAWGEGIEEAEVQALYSRAIGPWFDLQAGLRQDLAGPKRTHAVLGVQGLAPYLFEVDAALFLSARGELSARIEAEADQRITQRLILQPRLEAELSAQNRPQLGQGGGLDELAAGLRLRYEITPELAPYLGVERVWRLGDAADTARRNGERAHETALVAGLRFWF